MRIMLTLLVALALAGSARAENVTYISTSRSIAASTNSGVNLSDGFPVAGPWSSARFAFNPSYDNPASTPNSTGLSGGGGYATHVSTFGISVIDGQLLAKAWDGLSGFGGTASSVMSATFTLPASTPCQIGGSWSTDYNQIAGATPEASFLLSGPGGTVYSGGYGNPSGYPVVLGVLSFIGTLPAGQYTLTARASYSFSSLGSVAGAQQAALNFSLAVPAPGASVPLALLTALGVLRRERRTPNAPK
jgi:hypothetical protein